MFDDNKREMKKNNKKIKKWKICQYSARDEQEKKKLRKIIWIKKEKKNIRKKGR